MGVAAASTSTAHVYGNVTSFVTEYLKSLFPNYFKTVNVSSAILYRDFADFNNKAFAQIKKRKPMMIIRPRVEINPTDIFLHGTALTGNHSNQFMERGYSNLQPFIRNSANKVEVRYLLNRMRIIYDVTIVVETQMAQINMANYFKNRVPQDIPFFINTNLESHVPRSIIEAYASEVPMPLYDNNGCVEPLLTHLNGVSMFPITYKMKNSTGNDEFFRYYPANLMMSINDLSIDDGSKKGFTYDSFMINFTVPVEFNAAGLYYYYTPNEQVLANIKPEFDGGTLIPMFTVSNLFNLPLKEGWTRYGSFAFKTDVDKGYPDNLDMSTMYNESMLDFIKHHKDHGIPIEPFIEFNLLRDNKLMIYDEEYAINEECTELLIHKTNPSSSYRIIIHVNTYYINNLMKELHNLNED